MPFVLVPTSNPPSKRLKLSQDKQFDEFAAPESRHSETSIIFVELDPKMKVHSSGQHLAVKLLLVIGCSGYALRKARAFSALTATPPLNSQIRAMYGSLPSKHESSMHSPSALRLSDENSDSTSLSSIFSSLDQKEQPVEHGAIFSSGQANDNSYSANDWLHILKTLPKSTIVQAIRGPCLAVVVWSTILSLFYKLSAARGWVSVTSCLSFSSRPHSFLVSALGLLLVFRTNTAYQRFAEGRRIWEHIHSESRNLSRLVVLYQKDVGEQRVKRVIRLIAAFPYLLHQHIQPRSDPNAINSPFGIALPDRRGFREVVRNNAMSPHNRGHIGQKNNERKEANDNTKTKYYWVDRRSLPWVLLPKTSLHRVVRSSNRPLWVCDRLSQELTQVKYSDNFTSRERLQFLSQIGRLSQAIGQCERIHQTAVPLNYARHSLRSLTLWLFTLPFTLVEDFGLLTGPVMAFASWLLFGIYQIGYTIEDPFKSSLRLSNLCDAVYRDVMYGTDQMERRMTAFKPSRDFEEEWAQLDRIRPVPEVREEELAPNAMTDGTTQDVSSVSSPRMP